MTQDQHEARIFALAERFVVAVELGARAIDRASVAVDRLATVALEASESAFPRDRRTARPFGERILSAMDRLVRK